MDALTIPDMFQTYLLFVALPVVFGFTFNVVALLVIINADLIWQRIAGPRGARQQRETNSQPTTGPRLFSGEPSD